MVEGKEESSVNDIALYLADRIKSALQDRAGYIDTSQNSGVS
jgi:hypothetical protein